MMLLWVANSLAAVASFLVFPAPVGPMDSCSDYFSQDRRGFQINDRSDLDQLLNNDVAEACSNETLYLTSDIDLDGLGEPIDRWFGTFNGNGYRFTDSNLGPTDSEPPLFTAPFGDIEIINVIRIGDVSGDLSVGGLIGNTNGQVTITNSYTTGNTTGSAFVGGFVGSASGQLTITSSYTTGNTTGFGDVGGLIGNTNGQVTITNSYTTGNTTGELFFDGESYLGGHNVGGLIGFASGQLTITKSYTTGDTTGHGVVGGLIGWSYLGDITIINSYTTGNTTGDPSVHGGHYVGGHIGVLEGEGRIVNSYTTGNTTGGDPVGGFVGAASLVPTIVDSFCREASDGCTDGGGVSGTPADVSELTSQSFLSQDHGWNFSSVWCFRNNLNDGFPVLRAIAFGPGDTNSCRSTRASLRDVTFEPAGGTCTDHTSVWTVRFRGSYTLPTATDCTRDGYIFQGWTRDPTLTAPENLLTSRVSSSGTLTAVWGLLPTAPKKVDVLANFLCRQNCNSALIVWPASNTVTDTPIVTIDDVDATCTGSGESFGLRWCWITGLTSGKSHTASVAWRNQFGAGPSSRTSFDLN